MAAGLTAIMHGLECIPRKGSVFHHSTSIIIISGITHTVKYHEVRGWCEAIDIQFWYYPLPAAAAAATGGGMDCVLRTAHTNYPSNTSFNLATQSTISL